jgi:hypothetical protein
MYNFKHITYKEIPKLIEYNKQTYSERGGYTKSIIDFWVARHSEAVSDILTVEKDGKFYGQEFYSKMAFYYKGVYEESHWCFDLIVDQKLRKDCIGLDFMQYALEEYPNYYCTGSGPDAVKLHLALGKQLLGDIRKYVGLVNPLWLATSLFRGKIAKSKYPRTIDHVWRKVESFVEMPKLEQPFNVNLFEVSRDAEFFQWRFFNDFHPYVVYVNDTTGTYFVVTTIVQKHITAIVLLDFRCSLNDTKAFEQILKATHKLANKIYIPIVICGSSHTLIDRVLESNHYISIGRPRPIIGTKKYKGDKEAIKKRTFAFVTLADSDGEITW